MSDLAQPDNQPDARPDWLPENFDSPEALVKSYQEAQRKISQQGEDLSTVQQNYADLAAQLEDFQAQQAQQPVQQQPQSNEWLYSMYENDPIATTALIAKQAADAALAQVQQGQGDDSQDAAFAELLGFQAEQAMAAKYPDWNEVTDDIGAFIQANPDIITGQSLGDVTRALDIAYRNVKYDKLQEALASGQPVQTPDDQRLAKLQAQSQQGAGARPLSPDEQQAEWERIRNADGQPYWSGLPQ